MENENFSFFEANVKGRKRNSSLDVCLRADTKATFQSGDADEF